MYPPWPTTVPFAGGLPPSIMVTLGQWRLGVLLPVISEPSNRAQLGWIIQLHLLMLHAVCCCWEWKISVKNVVLQVNSVSFFEHHSIDGDHQFSVGNVLPHSIRQLCVMETEVTNRTESPLQVQVALGFTLALNLFEEPTLDY